LNKTALESGKPVMILDVQSHASARHVHSCKSTGWRPILACRLPSMAKSSA
jgi:hypothetical protein